MIELVRHIEILLLENDCVVVPGFGGFIAHYMPASWNTEEQTFSPPIRTIGFNPQLKMNDGLLVQSYMETYNTDFSDATKILEKGVDKLIETLHRDGKTDMTNIGEISLSVHGTYVFSSYDDKVTSPFLYGLDAFEIRDLRQQTSTERLLKPQVLNTSNKRNYEIRINRTVARSAVASIVAFVLFFYMSTPVKNTYVEKENYARLFPTYLLDKIEQQSMLTSSMGMNEVKPETKVATEPLDSESGERQEAPAVVSQQVGKPSPTLYHIIIASVAFEKDAQVLVADLKMRGYPNAQVLTNEEKVRVSIESYSTREKANKQLVELRKDSQYKNAWLLIR